MGQEGGSAMLSDSLANKKLERGGRKLPRQSTEITPEKLLPAPFTCRKMASEGAFLSSMVVLSQNRLFFKKSIHYSCFVAAGNPPVSEKPDPISSKPSTSSLALSLAMMNTLSCLKDSNVKLP